MIPLLQNSKKQGQNKTIMSRDACFDGKFVKKSKEMII